MFNGKKQNETIKKMKNFEYYLILAGMLVVAAPFYFIYLIIFCATFYVLFSAVENAFNVQSWQSFAILLGFLWVWRLHRNSKVVNSKLDDIRMSVFTIMNFLNIEYTDDGLEYLKEHGKLANLKRSFKNDLLKLLSPFGRYAYDDVYTARTIRNGNKITLKDELINSNYSM